MRIDIGEELFHDAFNGTVGHCTRDEIKPRKKCYFECLPGPVKTRTRDPRAVSCRSGVRCIHLRRRLEGIAICSKFSRIL